MIIKTYGTFANSAILCFQIGKLTYKVEFTNGNILADPVAPATLVTTNEALQLAIENDERFGRTIKLLREVNDNSDDSTKDKANSCIPKIDSTVSEETVSDVKVVKTAHDINDVVDYLKTVCKVPAVALTSVERIRKQALKNKVEFPNVKF